MFSYVSELGYRFKKLEAVTLEATSAAVTVLQGVPFYIANTGNATMYIGPTSAECATPGWPIFEAERQGPFVSSTGIMFMRGTAGQSAAIAYVEGA